MDLLFVLFALAWFVCRLKPAADAWGALYEAQR